MRLIILNGPWGVGKSTLAARLHAEMPGAFHVELDAIRRGISAYDADPEANFRFSIRIASDIIERCFEEGRDVIVDKMLRVHDLVNDIRAAGERHGATVHEIILWAGKDAVLARGTQRGYSTGVYSREKAAGAWDQMAAFVAERHDAVLVDTENKTADEVYTTVRRLVKL